MRQSATELTAQQLAFTQALRKPDSDLPNGVNQTQLKIYRELFFNNFVGVLSSAFPVIKSLFSEERWLQMVEAFYQSHECHIPEFPRMPMEFVIWLEQREKPMADEPDFLYELALWEWTELDVALDEADFEIQDCDIHNDSFIKLNPTLRLLSFDYPVHQISQDNQPQSAAAETQFLCAWRQPDFDVDFMQLNAPSAALLQILIDEPIQTVEQHLNTFAEMLGIALDENLKSFALGFIKDLQLRSIVIGG